MLPALGYRLEPMELVLDRSDKLVPGTARAVRKKVMQLRQCADALEVLASVGIPLHLDPAVLQGSRLCGMQRELDLLHGLLSGKRRMGVMLVGPALSGKTALFQGWLRRERDAGRERLTFATSGAQLVAGMSGLGQWQERARRVLLAAEQLDAVLYFDNLADLFGDRPEGQVDLAGAVRPFVQQGRVRLLGELRPQTLDLPESRQASFVGALQRVRIEPMDAAGAVEVVRSRVEHAALKQPNRPNLAPSAVQPLVDLVERYLPYQSHPGKAVRLLEEVRAVHEQRRRGEEDWDEEAALIDEGELLELFSMQSGIPLFLLRQDQGLKLQDVVQGLSRRLIGQEQAVHRVAETICMVKANLQGRGKPLATFLFVGPTGVGKTELARSLAQFLFGSEDRLVRFDMSEFMDAGAAQRLIQGTDRAEGMLTRRIRQQPFSVLLLDEFEKAHPAVLNLLLQVCGEGRLTDTAGRTAQFDNTMIIMTSNLGAAARRAPIGIAPPARDDAAYYEEQVSRAFRPEFVNRLDRIITFHALTRDQVRRVASLILKRIGQRRGLAEPGIELRLTQEALALLARDGYSEEYGARQLRRHLEQQLIAPAAQMLAELGSRARGATLQVATETDPEPLPTGRQSRLASRSQVTGLRLALVRGQAAKRGMDSGPLEVICALRREVQRRMALETVQEVKDQRSAPGPGLRGAPQPGPRASRVEAERAAHHRRDVVPRGLGAALHRSAAGRHAAPGRAVARGPQRHGAAGSHAGQRPEPGRVLPRPRGAGRRDARRRMYAGAAAAAGAGRALVHRAAVPGARGGDRRGPDPAHDAARGAGARAARGGAVRTHAAA